MTGTTVRNMAVRGMAAVQAGAWIGAAGALLGLLLPAPSAGPAAAVPSLEETADLLRFGNASAEFVFSKKSGACVQIQNKGTGDAYLKDTKRSAEGTYALEVAPGGPAHVASSFGYAGHRLETLADGSTELRIVARKPLPEAGGALETQLSVTLPRDSGVSRWRLLVTNATESRLTLTTTFPAFHLTLGDSPFDHDFVLFPYMNGVIEKCKRGRLIGAYTGFGPAGGHPHHTYPIRLMMPFLDHYDTRADEGIYVGVHDPTFANKDFYPQGDEAWNALKVVYPPREIPAGETACYADVVVYVHGGDWQKGVLPYRGWLEKMGLAPPASPACHSQLEPPSSSHSLTNSAQMRSITPSLFQRLDSRICG